MNYEIKQEIKMDAFVPPLKTELNRGNGIALIADYIADEEVENIVYEIEKTRVQMKVLEDHEKSLKSDLKELVGDAESIKDHTGYEIATWKSTYSNRFDTESFKTIHPEIYGQFLKQSEMRKFVTKRRNIEL